MSDKMDHDMAVIARLIKDESDRVRDENKRLKDENAKLCELVEKIARALGVGSGWCNRECGEEFGCTGDKNDVTGSCAIVDAMEELGWPVIEEDA